MTRRRKPVDDSKLDEVAMVDEEGREWTHRQLIAKMDELIESGRKTHYKCMAAIELLIERIQHEQVRRFEGHS